MLLMYLQGGSALRCGDAQCLVNPVPQPWQEPTSFKNAQSYLLHLPNSATLRGFPKNWKHSKKTNPNKHKTKPKNNYQHFHLRHSTKPCRTNNWCFPLQLRHCCCCCFLLPLIPFGDSFHAPRNADSLHPWEYKYRKLG